MAGVAGQPQHTFGYTADIESGKDKFLAAHHSPAERDYVAKYGQKAYRTASVAQEGVMPQPLTPGHTATVKIKALSEQEAAGPGTYSPLGVFLLCFPRLARLRFFPQTFQSCTMKCFASLKLPPGSYICMMMQWVVDHNICSLLSHCPGLLEVFQPVLYSERSSAMQMHVVVM